MSLSSSQGLAPASELAGIQYLRAIAALLVVAFHLEPSLERMGYAGPWRAALAGGVDIFFVISGLIMWMTTAGRAVTPAAFWRRRVARIVPLYWLITAVVVVLLVVAPWAVKSGRFDAGHILASFLFVPATHPVLGTVEPVLIPGWTLNYEIAFYLIFGAWLAAPPRLRFWGPAGVLGTLAALGFAGLARHGGALGFYTAPIVLEFVAGMALGRVLVERPQRLARLPAAFGWALVAVGLATLVLQPPAWLDAASRVIAWGVPATLVVLGALIAEAGKRLPVLPWLHRIGDASYSLYVTHVLVLSALGQLWQRLGLHTMPGGYALFGAAGVLACVLAALACHAWVERRLIARFRAPLRPHGVPREVRAC